MLRQLKRSQQPQRLKAPVPRRARGYTLVELIVVIMLIGIVSSVAASRLFGSNDLKARAYANSLAQVLAAGQRIAIAQRTTLYARVATAPGGLSLCLDLACTRPVAPAPGDDAVLAAPAGMGLQASTTAFSYDSLGRPSFGTALTLTVLASDGSSTGMGVTVQPETGHAAAF